MKLKYLPFILIFLFVNLASAQTPEPAPALKALHWHPDNARIAVGYADGRVEVIAAATSEILFTFSDADGSADNVLWSHDGSKFAAGIGRRLYVWDATTYARLHFWDAFETPITSLAWSPDGTELASTNRVSVEVVKLKFWNLASDQLRLSSWLGNKELAWDTTQNRLVGHNPLLIVAIDPLTGHPERLCPHCLSDGPNDMKWSPDGTRIAVATWNYIALPGLHGLASNAIYTDVHSIRSISWNPNSLYLASGDSEGQVQVWNVETLALTYEIATQQDAIYAVDWSPDGTRLAYGGTGGRLEIRAVERALGLNSWSYVYADINGGETHIYALNPFSTSAPIKIASVPSSLDDSTSSYDFAYLRNGEFALSPTSRWLAMTYVPTLAQYEWLHVLDLDTGDIHPILRSETSIAQMSWSADGNFLAFDAKRDTDMNQDTYVYNAMAQELGNIDGDADLTVQSVWLNQGVTLVTHKVINPGDEGQYCYDCETVIEEYNFLMGTRRTLTDFGDFRQLNRDYPFHLICDLSSSASGRYIAFQLGCEPAIVPFHLEYYVYDRVDGTLRSATPFTATKDDSEVSFFSADYAVDWYGDLLVMSAYTSQGYAPADAPRYPTPKPPVNATYLYDPATDTRHTLFADTFFDALITNVETHTLALYRRDENAILIATLTDTAIETTQTLDVTSALVCDFDWMPESAMLVFVIPESSQMGCSGESEIHFVDMASEQRITYPLSENHRLIGRVKTIEEE